MFFPKIDVKNDPMRRWHRPDRHFFANGACQVLAFAFLARYPELEFHARWIKPAAGFTGNHIYVTDGINTFDYHGITTEQRLLAFGFERARRLFPGWDAALVDLPTEGLVSEHRSGQVEDPAFMADDHGSAGESLQRLFQRAQRVDVEVVGGLVEQQHVGAGFQHLGQMHAVALAVGQRADLFLLVGALEIVRRAIATRIDLALAQKNEFVTAGNLLPHGLLAIE